MRAFGLCASFIGAGLLLTGFRPDDPDSDDLFRFTSGFLVEHYDSPNFRVHFTREGPDAVHLADADDNGVPDAVELVAATYEEALTFYRAVGFREPLSDLGTANGDGGDSRLDVYLVDFGGAADGHFSREACEGSKCSGYIVQENDYRGYGYPNMGVATRILASHELFHAIQAAYDAEQGSNWSEGSAVWASEYFDPSLNDFEGFIDGWFDQPSQPIYADPTGPVASYSYGMAIFARYLSERFGNDIIRQLWEDLEDGARGVEDPFWFEALEALLNREHHSSFLDIWPEFAQWALRSGFGGEAGETFAEAAHYPQIAREEIAPPWSKERLRLYPASMHVWSLPGGGTHHVAVTSNTANDQEGLFLLFVRREGHSLHIETILSLQGSLDLHGADEGMLALVHAGTQGASMRPSICVGDEAWVESCLDAWRNEGSEEPGNTDTDTDTDTESPSETDTDEVPEPTAPSSDDGCGGAQATLSLWTLAWMGRRKRSRV